MKHQIRKLWTLAGLCLILVLPAQGEGKPFILKFATLAPEGSAWMKTFHKVNSELDSRTGGALKMRAYPGGVMGDDQAVLRKMRIGQLHMAGITGLGLGFLCNDIQVLGAPFLFQNYDEVDYVLSRVTDRFEQIIKEKGYILVNWSEFGFIYMMSTKPINTLEDLQGAKVWMPEGDPIAQGVFEKAGVSAIPLQISDVLMALKTGLVDVIYSPPVGAIILQWHTKVKYLTRVPLSYSLGGVVMTKEALTQISKDHRKILREIFLDNVTSLNAQTRKNNEEALQVMERSGITFTDVTPQELARLQGIAQEATVELAGKAFPKEGLEEIYKYLREVTGQQ